MDNRIDGDTRATGIRRPDFDEIIAMLNSLSNVAQATFLARYSHTLTPSLCRSMIKYAGLRLDHINSQLPEGDPHRERYEERKRLLIQQQSGMFISAQKVDKYGSPLLGDEAFDAARPKRDEEFRDMTLFTGSAGLLKPYATFKPSPGIFIPDPIPEPWGKWAIPIGDEPVQVPYPWVPDTTIAPLIDILDESGKNITVWDYVKKKGYTNHFRDEINRLTGCLDDWNYRQKDNPMRKSEYPIHPAEAFRSQNIAYNVVKEKLEDLLAEEMRNSEYGIRPTLNAEAIEKRIAELAPIPGSEAIVKQPWMPYKEWVYHNAWYDHLERGGNPKDFPKAADEYLKSIEEPEKL